jgi:hypothetical protein
MAVLADVEALTAAADARLASMGLGLAEKRQQ